MKSIYGSSRLYYRFFMFFVLAASSNILFYTIASLFLPESGKNIVWLYPAVLAACLFAVIVFGTKWHGFFKFLALLAIVPAVIFFSKYFVKVVIISIQLDPFNDIYTLAISGIVFLVIYMTLAKLSRRFEKVYYLLDYEKNVKDFSEYMHWLNGELGDKFNITKADWFVRFMAMYGSLLIILCFISLALHPEGKWLLSVLLVVLALGSIGMYLVLNQFGNIFGWKFKGFIVKPEVVVNWNRLIRVFFVPLTIIPVLIPWNFTIFNSKAISDFLYNWISKLNIQLGHQGEDAVSASNMAAATDATNVNIAGASKTMLTVYKVVFYIIIGVVAVFILLGVLGFFVFLIYKDKKKSAFVQFMINRYLRLKEIIDFLRDFLYYIFVPILTLLGLVKKEEEKGEKLEKQFRSFFEGFQEMTSEKKREIESIIKDFIRFIQTASRLVTAYYFYQGPMEYTKKVIENRPHLEKELSEIVTLFNESRYSLHLLSEQKRNRFTQLIEAVIQELVKV